MTDDVIRAKIFTEEDFTAFNDLIAEDGWEDVHNKNNLNVWKKTVENSPINIVKLRYIFNPEEITPELLYDVLHDHEYRKTWDDNMIEGYVIEHLNASNEVGYYAAKVPFPCTNRDFVNQRSWRRNPDDQEWLIVNHSVHHDDCPPKKSFVRAWSHLTGYRIRTIDAGTEFIYCSQSDARGSIPTSIMNFIVTKLAPKVVGKLQNACHSYNEWKAENEPDNKPWLNDHEE